MNTVEAEFTALNGGPMYKFSPAILFAVHCVLHAAVSFTDSRVNS